MNIFKYTLILSIGILSTYTASAQLEIPNGRRLREIVADKYPDGNLLIGGTTGSWAFWQNTGRIMDREFSYVTPENDFKQPAIHPDLDKWSWSKSDAWNSHIIQKNQVVRIHGPISPQCSNWAKDDSRTAIQLEKNMREYMEALCKRYNGRPGYISMDVVNEVVLDGQWHKNKPGLGWEVPWFIIGQDTDKNKTPLYIKYAFEIATEYAPDMKLVFNHHEKTIGISSWNRIKETIAYLRDQNLRVDGIGWQSHISVGWEKIEGQQQALRDLIDWAHANDLEFNITEQSVYLTGNSPALFHAQAETYKAIIDILVEKSKNGPVRWNTWHIDDADGWRGEEYPSMFDKSYKAKPAYYAVQLALETKGDYTTKHRVNFAVKNSVTKENIENAKVKFNGEILETDSTGKVSFQATADIYNVEVEKRFVKPYLASSLSVYSDTVFTLLVDTLEVKYNTEFNLLDKYSGNVITSVNVAINNETEKTDHNGKAVLLLKSKEHLALFSKEYYKNYEATFQVNSDTAFTVEMEKSHATVKFSVKQNSQPINNALVILNGDTLKTTALGICKFKNCPVDITNTYKVISDTYSTKNGVFSFKTDTTINLQMFTTGAELNEASLFRIYPNPAKNYIYFEPEGYSQIAIYSITGKLEKQISITGNRSAINISDLKNGLYILKAFDKRSNDLKSVKLTIFR